MYRLGRYYEGQPRFDLAINAYREAIRRDPLMVEAYTALGTSLAAQQRYDEAIRQFQAAIVLAPNAAHLHNNLGYAYLLSGQSEQAVKVLEKAQGLDSAHAKSAENLRVARAQLGNSGPETASSSNTNVAVQPVTTPQPGSSLVEVAPQVFELRTSPKPRHFEKIEAVPLPPIREPQARTTSASGFKLEISNGNGVSGLAKRVAGRLGAAGVRTARLTNQRPFNQPTTEVQYREGYAAAATALASKLQHPVQVKPNHDLASHIRRAPRAGQGCVERGGVCYPAGRRGDENRCALVVSGTGKTLGRECLVSPFAYGPVENGCRQIAWQETSRSPRSVAGHPH